MTQTEAYFEFKIVFFGGDIKEPGKCIHSLKKSPSNFTKYLKKSIGVLCIRNRLTVIVENKLGEYQAGFRKNKSTVDQIFTLKQIVANSV